MERGRGAAGTGRPADADGRLAAFGISAPGTSGRIGIRVIDLGTLMVVRDIEAGIVAEAVGWIAPDRLAAFLQSGAVIVVDPRSGQELARESLGAVSCPYAPPSAVTPLGFAFVVAVAGSAVVVLADASGSVQRVKLDDIPLGFSSQGCQEAGLAVDPIGLVAYVAGAGAPVAAIDLRTLRSRRHGQLPASRCSGCGAQRSAVWLGHDRLAVAGVDIWPRRRAPTGVALVDTRTWSVRVIARRAGAVRRVGNRLLVYDGRHPSLRPAAGSGLRVYDRAGRLRHPLLRGERVGDVQVAGARAYARTRRGLRVIDLRRNRVIASLPRERRDVDLIVPR